MISTHERVNNLFQSNLICLFLKRLYEQHGKKGSIEIRLERLIIMTEKVGQNSKHILSVGFQRPATCWAQTEIMQQSDWVFKEILRHRILSGSVGYVRCCFSQWLLTSIKMIKFCFWTEKEIKVNPDPGSARFSTSQGMTLWLRTICDDRTRRRDSFWSAPNRLNNTRSQKQRDINIKAKLHIPDSGIPRVVRKLPNKCGLETGSSSRIKALISVGTSSVESDRYFRPMKTLANVFTKRWTDWRIASGVGGARERNTRLWKSPVEFVHPKISTRMYSLKKFCRS